MKRLLLFLLLATSLFGQGQDSIRAVNGVLTISIAPAKSFYKVFVDQTITSTAFTGQVAGTIITVYFLQDSTGHSVTFGGNISSGCTVASTASATTACQFVFDAANNQWAVSGGGGGNQLGASAFYATNYGVNPNVQYAFTVTCNNLSQTITTGANDPAFTAADVGKIIFGVTSQSNIAPNCPPQGIITAVGGAHSVTVSNAATGTTTTGSLAYGSQDDGANLQTAFAASLGKGCLYLPNGAMFFSVPPFIDSRSGSATGYPPCIIGQANTILTPLPTFNYANCTTGTACVFTWAQAANNNPNYAYLSNMTIFGIQHALTGTGTSKTVFNFQRVTAENIWVWGWDNGIGNAFTLAPPDSAFSLVSFKSATVGMSCTGSGPSGGQVTIEQGYIGGGGAALSVGTGCLLITSKLQVQTGSNGPLVTVATGNGNGGWYSYGDEIYQGAGTADSIRLNSGNLALHDDFVFGAASNTLGAVDCNGSGANALLYNTSIAGGAGGIAVRSVAGCNVNNADGQSTVTQGTLSLSGNNLSAPRETQSGSCTTNAATVTFKLTPYINAPLVLVSDTTSASTGAQATATNTTTATIHCNGASDTFVAQVIPNPI